LSARASGVQISDSIGGVGGSQQKRIAGLESGNRKSRADETTVDSDRRAWRIGRAGRRRRKALTREEKYDRLDTLLLCIGAGEGPTAAGSGKPRGGSFEVWMGKRMRERKKPGDEQKAKGLRKAPPRICKNEPTQVLWNQCGCDKKSGKRSQNEADSKAAMSLKNIETRIERSQFRASVPLSRDPGLAACDWVLGAGGSGLPSGDSRVPIFQFRFPVSRMPSTVCGPRSAFLPVA
jgi:hypothetical protein